ncbi:MAG: outer membrane beta-barrel protein, partial [Bacteroidota bacterium]
MKRFFLQCILIWVMAGIVTNQLSAQKIYVNVDAGYGMKMSTQTMYFDGKYFSQNNAYTNTYKAVNVSLGKGFNFGASVGYMFTKNIGVELGVSYLVGSKNKTKSESTTLWDSISSYSSEELELSSNMLRLVPSVVFAAGCKKVDSYARIGLIVGFGSVKMDSKDVRRDVNYVEKRVQNGGVAFGLASAVGVRYNINELISVFAEVD